MDFVEELSAGRIEAVLSGGQVLACLRSAACKELAGVTTSFGKLTSFDLLRIKATQHQAQIFQHQKRSRFASVSRGPEHVRLSELDTGMD